MAVIAFEKLDYLETGNERQQHAYVTLQKYAVFNLLAAYDPILVGTVPIDIDIPGSDLDIICCAADLLQFEAYLIQSFSRMPAFTVKRLDARSAVVGRFMLDGWAVEIWCQDLPTTQQLGYRHMLVEYELLERFGPAFRQQVRALKVQGYKTEPAFASVMGIAGDPYEELLNLNHK